MAGVNPRSGEQPGTLVPETSRLTLQRATDAERTRGRARPLVKNRIGSRRRLPIRSFV